MGGQQSHTEVDATESSIRALTAVKVEPSEKSVPASRLDSGRIRDLTRLLTAEKRRQKDNKYFDDGTAHHMENMVLLKQLYKKMDPRIMKTSTYVTHGDVQLSFKYDCTQQLLLVKVISCRDLDAKDLRGKSSDPYVKLQLFGEGFTSSIKQTHTIKRTLSPTFNEIFAFEDISPDRLANHRLILQVWDHDILESDDLLGEAIVPIGNIDFFLQPLHTAWYSLHAETEFGITGDLEVTLSYKLPETMVVTLHRGNNLMNKHEDGNPNPFVQLQIPGVQSVYKTKIQYGTVNPVWEESFEFKVPREELACRYIILHAIDFDDSENNESLGQIIIELDNFSIEEGFHGSFELADLKNSDRLRAKWFQHGAVQEFRESLVAHAALRHPNFLFARHTGTKMVRVRNRKAGAEAKLRIVNGIPVH